MDIDSLNQVMSIDNLDFIELLVVNRQNDALYELQEKQHDSLAPAIISANTVDDSALRIWLWKTRNPV